jgi:hypothetical protein
MGGSIGRWVALSLVVRLLATGVSSLGSNPDISQKYEMGDIIKQRSGQQTIARQKKYAKKIILLHIVAVLKTVKNHRT